MVSHSDAAARSTRVLRTLLEPRHARRVLELVEAPLEHKLGADALDPEQVEDHIVTEVESRVEPVRLALDHVFGVLGLELLVDHHDDDTPVVETTPTGPTRHLDVLARRERPEFFAVKLADVVEDDRLGRHVEADRERLGRKEHLDQALLEENLDDLLENRQQAAVVDSDAAFEERQQALDLRQIPVVLRKGVDCILKDRLDEIALVIRIELELRHLKREPLAFALRKGEDDDRIQVLDHDHLDNLVDVADACSGGIRVCQRRCFVGDKPSVRARLTALERAALLCLALAALAAVRVGWVLANHLLQPAHRLLKIVLPEHTLLVDDEKDAVSAGREEVVLERRRPEVGVDDVARLVVRFCDPLGKLERVGDRRRQEDVVDRVR